MKKQVMIGNQVLLCVLNALADRVGNFARLADAEAYGAVAVADNNKSRKLEDTSALDRLGYTVNGDNSFF